MGVRTSRAFRADFRYLLLQSLAESAQLRLERHRREGHRLRAWQAARESRMRNADLRYHVARHKPPAVPRSAPGEEHVVPQVVPAVRPRRPRARISSGLFGPKLKTFVTLAWIGSGVLLLVDVLVVGLHTWETTAADLSLLVLTIVWFFVALRLPND